MLLRMQRTVTVPLPLRGFIASGRHVMSCHVMSCHVMSCHVMSCHVMSCHVMSCHVFPDMCLFPEQQLHAQCMGIAIANVASMSAACGATCTVWIPSLQWHMVQMTQQIHRAGALNCFMSLDRAKHGCPKRLQLQN